MQGRLQGLAGHSSAGKEDSVQSLLVQLIGGCGLGSLDVSWGRDLRIPSSVPHRGSRVGWLARLTTTTIKQGRGVKNHPEGGLTPSKSPRETLSAIDLKNAPSELQER